MKEQDRCEGCEWLHITGHSKASYLCQVIFKTFENIGPGKHCLYAFSKGTVLQFAPASNEIALLLDICPYDICSLAFCSQN